MKKIIGLMILLICALLIYQNINLDNKINNDNIYFAFYNGNEKINEMPGKDNADGLVFNYALCDNGATVLWNKEEWAPLVKNLSKSKTKCSLYFGPKPIELDKDIPIVESDDGLYKVEHNDLTELDNSWSKTEYRYAGVNPNNYVTFNNEIWRIIGLVNVQTENGVEQRIKIIRPNGINDQKDFADSPWDFDFEDENLYHNDWTDASLMKTLNDTYYNSKSGECSDIISFDKTFPCDFTGNSDLPKGLDNKAREMVDSDVIWKLGRTSEDNYNFYNWSAQMVYEMERGKISLDDYPTEWSKENDKMYHNGIGLIYPSDNIYAVGGDYGQRYTCLENVFSVCYEYDWLKLDVDYYLWTLTTFSDNIGEADVVGEDGFLISSMYDNNGVWPTLYLKPSVKILSNSNLDTYGSINNPFILS